jgi:hypothetical protein
MISKPKRLLTNVAMGMGILKGDFPVKGMALKNN